MTLASSWIHAALAQSPWLPESLPPWWPTLSELSGSHWLGLLGLAVLWTNMLLIAAAALIAAREQWRSRAASSRLLRAVVIAGEGPGGALASHRVEQVGRTNGDGVIYFHDRRCEGALHGGRVQLEDGRAVTILPLEGVQRLDFWPDPAAVARAAACPDSRSFASAEESARKARGFPRALEVSVAVGDTVWLSGHVEDHDEGHWHLAVSGGVVFISAFQPSRWVAPRVALALGFAALCVLLTLACSVLALWPPVFGTVSAIGALGGAALWLGFMPLGTAVRDMLRPPSTAFVRGVWRR